MSQLVSSLDGKTAMENDSFLIQSKCDDYQKLRLLSLLQCAMDCFLQIATAFLSQRAVRFMATPGNTITYHNALRLSPQNFV